MNRSPAISLSLHWNTSAAGVSGLSPKSQVRSVPSALGGGAGTPRSAKEGCSGQAPVSITPTITPSPALAAPPSCWYRTGAPMNWGLESVRGLRAVSFWTAATPGRRSRSATLLPASFSATPP
jgi:hypothetical protein